MSPAPRDKIGPFGDDELLALLRKAVTEGDPAPASLRTFALAAEEWGRGQHLLLGGQVEPEQALAGARSGDGDAEAKHFRYDDDGWELYVVVEGDLREPSVSGTLSPPVQQITRISPSGEKVSIDCDEFGRFEFAYDGKFALAFEVAGDRPVRTDLIG